MNKYHVLGALLGLAIGLAIVCCLRVYQDDRPIRTIVSDIIPC